MIIDAKYYQDTLSASYDAEKIHSANLYQLVSYLSNCVPQVGEMVSGMLIYPKVDRELRENYEILGYEVAIRTLDLNQDWRGVETDLLEILEAA